MRSLAGSVSLAALLLTGSLAEAASSLVLTDGQIIKGTEIKRQGDAYLVTMADGNTVAFPVALVKELKFADDPPAKAPPGFDYSGPRTLAGPTTQASQDRKDQLKELGPPTRWSKDVIDPTWVPTSAYDPDKDVLAGSRATWSKNAVDTTWKPTSAFDLDKDVLAGSRATWSRSVIDTTWTPKDGWGFTPRPVSGTPPPPEFVSSRDPAAPEPVAAPSEPAPWTCAERLFAKNSPSMSVKTVKSPQYASLGVPLYEATGMLGGASRKAVFTTAGGTCRLVGGDADALNGLNLPADHAMTQDAASLNAAMASRGGAGVPTGVDKVDYALAFVSLTDPLVSGSSAATLKLIAKPEEIRSIAAKSPATCSLSKGKRRKEERTATSAFAAPKVAAGAEGDVVTFLTWSSAGGVVSRNTVVLARGGAVSTKRDAIATHLGAHTE